MTETTETLALLARRWAEESQGEIDAENAWLVAAEAGDAETRACLQRDLEIMEATGVYDADGVYGGTATVPTHNACERCGDDAGPERWCSQACYDGSVADGEKFAAWCETNYPERGY